MGGKLSKCLCCCGSPEPNEITFPSVSDPIATPQNELSEGSVERNSSFTTKRTTDVPINNFVIDSWDTKDDINLLTIFPQEVWYMIVDKATEENDQENLSNSSQFFRRLLLPHRHQFLFRKVVNLLIIYFPDDYEESEVDQDDDYVDLAGDGDSSGSFSPVCCNSCGRKQKRDWYSEFLKLRLVCQQWCGTIDNMFQSQSPHCTESNDTEERYCHGVNQLARVLYGGHDPHDCLAYFEATHGHASNTKCPFLGRQLRFFVTNTRFENGDGIIDLLQKYGQHIHYATMVVLDNGWGFAYSRLTLVLGFLPNLKSLQFHYMDVHNRIMSFEELTALRDDILLNPMPTFRSLTHLRVFNLSSPILDELLLRNNHISTLDVQRSVVDYYYDIDIVPLPNLNQFSMNFFSDDTLEPLEEVNWSLEKLDLEFKRDMFIPWKKIFDLVESNWKGSLTNLRLVLPKATSKYDIYSIIMDSFHLRLNLAAVKTLTLEVQNYCFLDFILGMKATLAHLTIIIKCAKLQRSQRKMMQAKRSRQVIEFYEHFHKLYESSIWVVFPRLHTFEFKGPDGKQLKFCRRGMNPFHRE